jgi:hypothetical protein
MVDYSPRKYKALGLVPSTEKKQKKNKRRRRKGQRKGRKKKGRKDKKKGRKRKEKNQLEDSKFLIRNHRDHKEVAKYITNAEGKDCQYTIPYLGLVEWLKW